MAVLALLLATLAGAAAQLSLPPLLPSLVNVTASDTTQLPGAGPVYKREDTLQPFYANLYGIPVPAGVADPDIYLTLDVLNQNINVGLYCNPGWGQYGDTSNYPQPGYAVWQSDTANGNDTILISKNDKLYRPPYARSPNTTEYDAYTPYFICSIINTDPKVAASYRLEADLIVNNATLSLPEQRALANIYDACCSTDNCMEWKSYNAKAGSLVTDFCSVPGQMCTPDGHLLRLDLRGANLGCTFPATDFAAFQWLSTLNLGRNPNLLGKLADVFSALSGAPVLQNINLFRDIGLDGPLAPVYTAAAASICKLAKASLQHLNLETTGAEGPIPPCLFGPGSQIVEVQLGSNNFTGEIPDVFTAASPLEVLNVASNQLSGPLPPSMGSLLYLTDLDITGNSIAGTIPETLGNVPTLKHVVLKFNNLTGKIPSSLATAPLVETLDLKGNQLTSLPDEWIAGYEASANASFVNVRFSFNQIEGSFPIGLEDAPQLTFLVINNNSMTGILPNRPGMFPALRALNASHNNFVGSIPAEFGSTGIFTQKPLQFQDGEILEHVFDLSFNELTGDLPAFIDSAKVPHYARSIFLRGNQLTITCNTATDFLADVCVPNAGGPSDASLYPAIGTGTTSPFGPHSTGTGPVYEDNTAAAPLGSPDAGNIYSASGPQTLDPYGLPSGPIYGPDNTNTNSVLSQSQNDVVPLTTEPDHGNSNKGKIVGGVVGAGLALVVVGGVLAFFLLRKKGAKSGSNMGGFDGGNAGGGMGNGRQSGLGASLKGALAQAKSNKFDRFTEGLEMSDSQGTGNGAGNGRIQGFGSGV